MLKFEDFSSGRNRSRITSPTSRATMHACQWNTKQVTPQCASALPRCLETQRPRAGAPLALIPCIRQHAPAASRARLHHASGLSALPQTATTPDRASAHSQTSEKLLFYCICITYRFAPISASLGLNSARFAQCEFCAKMKYFQDFSARQLAAQLREAFAHDTQVPDGFAAELIGMDEAQLDPLHRRAAAQILYNNRPCTAETLDLALRLSEGADSETFVAVPATRYSIPVERQKTIFRVVLLLQRALCPGGLEQGVESFEAALQTAQAGEVFELEPYVHYNYAEFALKNGQFKLALKNYKLAVAAASNASEIRRLAQSGQQRILAALQCRSVTAQAHLNMYLPRSHGFRRHATQPQQGGDEKENELLDLKIQEKVDKIRRFRAASCQSAVTCRTANFSQVQSRQPRPVTRSCRAQSTATMQRLPTQLKKTGVFYQKRPVNRQVNNSHGSRNQSLADFAAGLNVDLSAVEKECRNSICSPSLTSTLKNYYDPNNIEFKVRKLQPAKMLYVPDEISIIGKQGFKVPEMWRKSEFNKNDEHINFSKVYDDLIGTQQ